MFTLHTVGWALVTIAAGAALPVAFAASADAPRPFGPGTHKVLVDKRVSGVRRSLGGDRDKAGASFARAVELGPDRLVIRWGRARFFDVLMKNRDGFVLDLQWVATADPAACSDAPAWKAYVKRDAEQWLKKVDSFF